MRQVAATELASTPYPNAPRAAIDGLIDGSDPDARAIVAVDKGRIVGFVIFGTFAGSDGAGRLQLVVTAPELRRMGIGQRLVEGAIAELHASGARFALVEMPADPALAIATALLERCGFQVDARVRDFYRDGIDLVAFRRDAAPEPRT